MLTDIKKLIKSNKYISEGEAICRDIQAVDKISRNNKISMSKKLDILEKYILGIKKSKDSSDMLNIVTEFQKISGLKCKKYLNSMGFKSYENIKKEQDRLSGAQEKIKIKKLLEKSNSTPELKKSNSQRSSLATIEIPSLPTRFINELTKEW